MKRYFEQQGKAKSKHFPFRLNNSCRIICQLGWKIVSFSSRRWGEMRWKERQSDSAIGNWKPSLSEIFEMEYALEGKSRGWQAFDLYFDRIFAYECSGANSIKIFKIYLGFDSSFSFFLFYSILRNEKQQITFIALSTPAWNKTRLTLIRKDSRTLTKHLIRLHSFEPFLFLIVQFFQLLREHFLPGAPLVPIIPSSHSIL